MTPSTIRAAGGQRAASADLAATVLTGLGVPVGNVDEVRRLVLLTAGHTATADDRNGALLCDADLAILAAVPDAYDEYAAGCARNTHTCPTSCSASAGPPCCGSCWSCPRCSGVMPAWEPRARANLERELAGLS